MPRLLFVVLACALALPLAELSAQSGAMPSDLNRLTGATWTGTLTYRDYSTDARTSIKAGLQLVPIAASPARDARWEWRVAYADEPHANSVDTVALSADGRTFRGATVTERTQLADGRVRIVTEEDGRDNDNPARIRFVYLIGERTASLQKLVRYGEAAFFERNIYEWARREGPR